MRIYSRLTPVFARCFTLEISIYSVKAVNPTLVLTFLLFSLMVGIGVLSSSWGYALGREALKGITQPDTRPGSSLLDAEAMPPRRETVALLSEDEILAEVQAHTAQYTDTNRPVVAASTPETTSPDSQGELTASDSFITDTALGQLPVSDDDQGVMLQVLTVRQENNALVLDVSLQNQGDNTFRFLYSFMELEDDQGRTFSGDVEGLPTDLMAGDGPFYGTVSLPIALLDGAEHLSLSLTDYPEEQLSLQLPEIPLTVDR